MNRTYKISLSPEFYSDTVHVSQYDSDYNIIFNVYDKYSAASSIDGMTAHFTGTRSDGLGFTFDATASGSSVTFEINTSMTAVAGTNTAEIVFYDENDLYFGSANVQIVVEPAARPNGTIDADTERAEEIAEEIQQIVDTAAATVEASLGTLSNLTTTDKSSVVAAINEVDADVSSLNTDLTAINFSKLNAYTAVEFAYPDYRINTSGSLVGDSGCEATAFIECESGMYIQWYGKSFYYNNAAVMCCIAFYDENKTFLSTASISQIDGSTDTSSKIGYITTTVPDSAKYFRASTKDQDGSYCRLFDVNSKLSDLFDIDFGEYVSEKRVLTNSDDMNNITESGIYSYSSGSRPTNSPDIAYGGQVLVFTYGSTTEQLFFCNIDSTNVFAMRLRTSSWTDWLIIRDTYNFVSRKVLTSSDNLNSVLVPGVYEYATSSIPTNAPISAGGLLAVYRASAARTQVFFNATEMYRRFYSSSGTWGEWIDCKSASYSMLLPNVLEIEGKGATGVYTELKLVSGNTYRIDVLNPTWNHTASANGVSVFWLRDSNGENKVVDYLGSSTSVATPIIFTARNNDYLLTTRADEGETVYVAFTDITSSGSGGTEYKDDAHLNVWRYTHQLGNLKWTPKATVETGEGSCPANVEVTGAPYSSVKEMHKYIGQDVSIHTFMTAVNDPYSLMYTEYVGVSGSQSAYGREYNGTNCTCYFGSVCSALVSMAIGRKSQTASWEYQTFLDMFEVLDTDSVLSLEVGDILSYDGHACIITKIDRNGNGSIETIEMDEHVAPIVMKTYYPSVLADRYSFHNGKWCRYKHLNMNTDYKPSTFVLLDGESVYNRGDFVFIDGKTSRTYYRSINSNSDSTFTASNWTEIQKYTSGTEYERNFNNPVFVSDGDHLYKCINTHTAGETIDLSNWEEIKRVFEWVAYPYVYNDDICTFAGDRASFRTNDLIYIDYTKGTYTSMQLYKDGSLINTFTLPASGYQLDVSSYCTGAGLYKARLTDGTNYSKYTYFEVIDTTVTATYENGFATINFSSTNGKPIDIQIPEISGRYACHTEPTASEISVGQITICPKARMYAETYVYPDRYEGFSQTVYARVLFEGEYGNAVSEMIELGTLTAESGILVYPNEPKSIGTVDTDTNIMLADRMDGNSYVFTMTAENSVTVSVLPAIGIITWANALPNTLVNGKTYLVKVENGIGNVTVVS